MRNRTVTLYLSSVILVLSVPAWAQQPAAAPTAPPPTATPPANPLDNVPDAMPFDVPYGAPISFEHAKAVIAAAQAEAAKRNWEGGKIVGAIGVSGGTGSQDEVVAKAGAVAPGGAPAAPATPTPRK